MGQIKEKYPLLRLYKDDLIRIINIFIDNINEFEKIIIQTDKTPIEIDEADTMEVSVPSKGFDEIEKLRKRTEEDIEKVFDDIRGETHKNETFHIVITCFGLNNSNINLWFAKDTAYIEFANDYNKIYQDIYSKINELLSQRKSKLNFINSKLIKYLFGFSIILSIFLYSYSIGGFYTNLTILLIVILFFAQKLWNDNCLAFLRFLSNFLSMETVVKFQKHIPLKKHCKIYLYDFKYKEKFKNKYLERIIYLVIGAFIYFVFNFVKDLIKKYFLN